MGHLTIMIYCNRQMGPSALSDSLIEHYSTIPDSDSKMEKSVLYLTARVKWVIRHYICLWQSNGTFGCYVTQTRSIKNSSGFHRT